MLFPGWAERSLAVAFPSPANPVSLFPLQGPATSAGPTTAQAGVRRQPCWCALGWPASRARSRSSTPTEAAPGYRCCQTPKGLADLFWVTTINTTFLSAFSMEQEWGGTVGGRWEGRKMDSGAKPSSWAGQSLAFLPSLLMVCSAEIQARKTPLW